MAEEPVLPKRVVYIGNSNQPPCLQDGEGRRAIYATLSYTWRPGLHFRTTAATYHTNKLALDFKYAPQSWQDATTILQALGIQYLWIDAICILQDSKEDWRENITQMSAYYKNSFLNIVAGLARHSEGCLGRRLQPRFLPCKLLEHNSILQNSRWSSPPAKSYRNSVYLGWVGSEAYYNPTGTDVQQYPDKWRYISPAHRRGWILQEIRLARRNLVFQDDEDSYVTAQLYLQCQQKLVWENGRSRDKVSGEIIDQATSWYRLIEQFSEKHLAYTSDRLPAISALAREYQGAFTSSYCAGIWSKDVIRGLLWYRLIPSPMPQQDTAPSWSWASNHGPLKHYWPPDATPDAECLHIEAVGLSADPFGQVARGSITLAGDVHNIRPLSFADELDSLKCEFEIDCGNEISSVRASCFLDHGDHGDQQRLLLRGDRVYSLRVTTRCALLLQGENGVSNTFRRLGLLVWYKSCAKLLCSRERSIVTII
jgi:hypothetical protein